MLFLVRTPQERPPHDWAPLSTGVLWVLVVWLGLCLPIALSAGCAGYQFGNRSLYRTDLKTIHVPMFQSNSLRLDLGEWLTEAVVKEIELRTPYKVVSNPLADSVMTGRIMFDTKRVLAENINDEPRNLVFNAAVHVTWIDNRGQILIQNVTSLGSNFVPEAGQSITTSEQVAIRKMAHEIVSQMEAQNW
jgi:hypothetical protein